MAIMLPFLSGSSFLILLPGLALMIWAQYKVSSTFKRFSKVPARAGVTGAEVARILLRARGLDVPIEEIPGKLSDHYDPRKRVLRLSSSVYRSQSVAAVGVAAHEAGHALQHADGYAALAARNAFAPVAGLASKAMMPLFFLGFLTAFRSPLILTGVFICFAVYAVFALITLPVEFNASSRAVKLLGNTGILTAEEIPQTRSVLNAAALTYVASALYAILNLVRIFLISRD